MEEILKAFSPNRTDKWRRILQSVAVANATYSKHWGNSKRHEAEDKNIIFLWGFRLDVAWRRITLGKGFREYWSAYNRRCRPSINIWQSFGSHPQDKVMHQHLIINRHLFKGNSKFIIISSIIDKRKQSKRTNCDHHSTIVFYLFSFNNHIQVSPFLACNAANGIAFNIIS